MSALPFRTEDQPAAAAVAIAIAEARLSIILEWAETGDIVIRAKGEGRSGPRRPASVQ